MHAIPFYPNSEDGTHCWQAAMKMVLTFFEPEREYSYDELDRISHKQPGKWTWPTASMLWFLEQGFELRLIEEFDYRAFAARGGDYLLERCGEEVGRAQIEKSDLASELAFAAEFATKAKLEVRIPDFSDIERLMREGYVIICNINASALHRLSGYSGHFVVICELAGDQVVLHDPGLPPRPAVRVRRADFDRAWSYPSSQDRNLLALRKKSKKVL